MSKMADLAYDIEEDVASGELTLTEIAKKHCVPLAWVEEIAQTTSSDEYHDSMDGDFDSAMASAGFGTDEDYGAF